MKNTSNKNSAHAHGKSEMESKKSTNGNASKLQKLFEDELKDIYWAEKALVKAIPKMVKKSSSSELADALGKHLSETEEQVKRIEQVFKIMGKPAQAKKCEAMNGLIKEAGDIMSESEEGVMRDAGIISAAQKVEHYEIATYGTLSSFAHVLGMEEIASLLEETLEEERGADEKLSDVASSVNLQAAEVEE